MKPKNTEWTAVPQGPDTVKNMNSLPWMGPIFLKALYRGLTRPSDFQDAPALPGQTLRVKNFVPGSARVRAYGQACGFAPDSGNRIPLPCFQSFFVGLLGRFITSEHFPLSPLGLIHTRQSLALMRCVTADEALDLSCTLTRMEKTDKGIESVFSLTARAGGETVWKGESVFLTRARKKTSKKEGPRTETEPLPLLESVTAPRGTGRRYALVSGDYNPHHLFTLTAWLFGFKRAIAHGMWTLARSLAGTDRLAGLHTPCRAEARFKLPVFMPARLRLGARTFQSDPAGLLDIRFDLRDARDNRPHLEGTITRRGG